MSEIVNQQMCDAHNGSTLTISADEIHKCISLFIHDL